MKGRSFGAVEGGDARNLKTDAPRPLPASAALHSPCFRSGVPIQGQHKSGARKKLELTSELCSTFLKFAETKP